MGGPARARRRARACRTRCAPCRTACARTSPRYLERHYARWLDDVRAATGPPLSVDIGAEFLAPRRWTRTGKALLVVVDCLRLDQWAMIRPLVSTARFDIETAHYFSILPTATPVRPQRDLQRAVSDGDRGALSRVVADSEDESSLNAHESRAAERTAPGADRAARAGALREGVHRRRRRRPAPAPAGAPGAGRGDGAGLQLHRPADARPHRELDAVRGGARHPGAAEPDPHLVRALAAAGTRCGRPSGAGCRSCSPPITARSTARRRPRSTRKRDTTSQPALQVRRGPASARTPTRRWWSRTSKASGSRREAPGTRLLLATGDRFFVYPTKLREYQARYRGAFLHGGVSPEEVILPIALLTPRRGSRRAYRAPSPPAAAALSRCSWRSGCSRSSSRRCSTASRSCILIPLLKHLFGTSGGLRRDRPSSTAFVTRLTEPLVAGLSAGRGGGAPPGTCSSSASSQERAELHREPVSGGACRRGWSATSGRRSSSTC